MLARAWFPLQSWCRRHPLPVAIVAAALTAWAGVSAWPAISQLSWGNAATVGGVMVIAAVCGRSVATAVAAVASAVVGWAISAQLPGAPLPPPTVLIAALVALIPLQAAMASARVDTFASAVARGTSYAVVVSQIIAASWMPHWSSCLALTIAVALGCVWCPTATARWTLLIAPHAQQPRALAIEILPSGRWVLRARVAVALLTIGAVMQQGVFRVDILLPLAVIWGIWVASTARSAMALMQVALSASAIDWAWKTAAILAGTSPAEAATGLDPSAFLIALGASQALPLLIWWGREHGRLPIRWCAPGCLVATMAMAPTCAIASAIGVASLIGVLVITAFTRREWRPGADRVGLARVRAVIATLAPYWRFYGLTKLRADPVYRLLATQTQPWGRVLDAGCGPGLIAGLAAVRGDATGYCGVDLDEDKLEIARRLLARCGRPLDDRWRLLKGRLPFPQDLAQRFDTACAIDVLHYWTRDQQVAVLRQLRAALEPDGRLFVRDGVSDEAGDAGAVSVGERFTTRIGFNPDTGTLCFLTLAAMRSALTDAGFAIEDCVACGGANRLWRCRADHSPAQVESAPAPTTSGPPRASATS